eukprot:TRINITY_DN1625_c0_g1_i2.p1 TRINITY_DN1625_c0_g1~~TRINITY_DN1625_c0_g1_i2.p1  ORF type:complete len:132 (+),score=31.11 TRINITY_DN1625_c0_g1_i2:40-396(+)
MAANYWASSHSYTHLRTTTHTNPNPNASKNCVLTRETVELSQQEDLKLLDGGRKELRQLHIYFANYIKDIAKKLGLRQRVVATATVYFKRFYLACARTHPNSPHHFPSFWPTTLPSLQ